MKTTIQIRFLVVGVSEADQFALGYDKDLHKQAKDFEQQLNQLTAINAIDWGNSIDGAADYEKVMKLLGQELNIVNIGKIKSELEKFLKLRNDSVLGVILGQFPAGIPQASRVYELRPILPVVCEPCGDMCHKCHDLLYSASTTTATYTPHVWVASSNGKQYNLNLKAEYMFVRQN